MQMLELEAVLSRCLSNAVSDACLVISSLAGQITRIPVLRRIRLGTYKVFCLRKTGLCLDLLKFCRAVVLSSDERQAAIDARLDFRQPLSLVSERRALRHAENVIIASLNRLPTR